MSPRPMRSRLLDLAVATVCVACVAAPLLPSGFAAGSRDGAIIESGGTVDQRVLQSGVISNPLDAAFAAGTSGTIDGAVSWDIFTTADAGMKLVVSTDRTPAMRDSQNGVDVPDLSTSPGDWSVGSGERRFGITATGPLVLSRFGTGSKWRGFEGGRSVEIARRGAPTAKTRTTLKLRAQFAAPLASDARPTASVRATAVLNL